MMGPEINPILGSGKVHKSKIPIKRKRAKERIMYLGVRKILAPLTGRVATNPIRIVSEDPQLHLVWIDDDRIFLKPLPYDLSKYCATASLRKAALGYMRTYFYLPSMNQIYEPYKIRHSALFLKK
ncbi:hypothetical protein N7451_008927 [Penicillium sp. IBT 35674x]|nr:hypothetical protein N7451_008927 [Penicillium sp. IBT 35674x]